MTAIGRLNEMLKQLKTLEDENEKGSTFSRLQAIAQFMDDLPDITQQLETAVIEVEEMKENFDSVWSEIGRQ